jgi:hypothetical protein
METFVIQIPTRPENSTEAGEDELRGVVEHVGSGCRETFTNDGELLAFLHSHHQARAKEAER